jgi:hypothetical protein
VPPPFREVAAEELGWESTGVFVVESNDENEVDIIAAPENDIESLLSTRSPKLSRLLSSL